MKAWIFAGALSVMAFASAVQASGQALAGDKPAASCPESSDPERQLALAMKLAAGDGMENNDAVARQCLAAAAGAGVPRVQLELALFLLHGKGGPVDTAGARHWLDRAAASGSETAARIRAELDGTTVAPDTASAPQPAAVPTRCRDTDEPERQLELAMKFTSGDGMRRNETTARACLTKAAEAGLPRAQLELALFLLQG